MRTGGIFIFNTKPFRERVFRGTDNYTQNQGRKIMSTILENKKTITPEWQSAKVQAEVLKSVASIFASLDKVLPKDNPQIIAEVKKILLINKEYYSTLPIKSPIDLVNAIGEYTVNVLGIKVAITDEISQASIVFEGGTLATKLAAINAVPPSEVPSVLESFKNGIVELGTQFGFKTEITSAEPDFIITFKK
jgi:hypothetical protein